MQTTQSIYNSLQTFNCKFPLLSTLANKEMLLRDNK